MAGNSAAGAHYSDAWEARACTNNRRAQQMLQVYDVTQRSGFEMKLSLDKSSTLYLIDGFSTHSVTVAKREYRHHLIITAEHIFEPWQAPAVPELVIADFDCLSGLELEVILLGTGKHQIFPPPLLQVEFGRKGIGFEVMNTAAACRTFNILAGEGRKVAAALIIPAGEAI
jgi:uncharacterized protein